MQTIIIRWHLFIDLWQRLSFQTIRTCQKWITKTRTNQTIEPTIWSGVRKVITWPITDCKHGDTRAEEAEESDRWNNWQQTVNTLSHLEVCRKHRKWRAWISTTFIIAVQVVSIPQRATDGDTQMNDITKRHPTIRDASFFCKPPHHLQAVYRSGTNNLAVGYKQLANWVQMIFLLHNNNN